MLPSLCRPLGCVPLRLSSSSLVVLRVASTLSPRPKHDDPVPPLPLSPSHKHPKLGLRPAPIKHVPSSSNHRSPIFYPPAPPIKSSPASSFSPSSHPPTAPANAAQPPQDSSSHDLIPPPEGASRLKKAFHHVVQLTKFYYRGVKLVVSRQRQVSEIRARIAAEGTSLTRMENRFIATQRNDVKKVIPFVLIALIAEEAIPLIVYFAPSMLPSTCILPSQRVTLRQKRNEKQSAAVKNNRALFARLESLETPKGHLALESLRTPGASTAVCDLLCLSTFGGDALRIRRISHHLQSLVTDDKLILQDNLKLSEKDLDDALYERGIIPDGLSLGAKEETLQWWLQSVNDPSTESPIFRRLSLLMDVPRIYSR